MANNGDVSMFDEMKGKLEKVIELMRGDLNGIKTGRAKPSMIEHIMVEAYPGSKMSLMELATISAPDPHLLVVQPWDHSVIQPIQKALMAGDMGLSPAVDGTMIRIPVPALTEERRREYVKLVKQKIESGKEMMRSIRNDEKKAIDKQKDDAGVSEDDIHAWMEDMQKVYESYMEQLEQLGESKEKELMEI